MRHFFCTSYTGGKLLPLYHPTYDPSFSPIFLHGIIVKRVRSFQVLARIAEMVVGERSVRRGERYLGAIGKSKRKRVATFFYAKITTTNDDVTVQK